MLTVAATHTGLARKHNHFEDQGHKVPDHSCANCVRRQFGGPFACNDGWPCGNRDWTDRGNRCLNWTDRGDAPV